MTFISDHPQKGITKIYLKGSSVKFYLLDKDILQSSLPQDIKTILTSTGGVYCLLDRNKLDYTGESDSVGGILSRVLNHIGKKTFDRVLISVSTDPEVSLSSIRMNLEDWLISEYSPPENTALGKPGRLSSDDQEFFGRSILEISGVLETLGVYPAVKVRAVSNPTIIDKMISSPYKPKPKKISCKLLADGKIKAGDKITFIYDPSIVATVLEDGHIEIPGSTGQKGIFSMSSAVITWNFETGRKKPGEINTIAGPEYWKNEDGKILKDL